MCSCSGSIQILIHVYFGFELCFFFFFAFVKVHQLLFLNQKLMDVGMEFFIFILVATSASNVPAIYSMCHVSYVC